MDTDARRMKLGVGREILEGRAEITDASPARLSGDKRWGAAFEVIGGLLRSENTEKALGGFSFFPAVSRLAIIFTLM